MQQFKFYFLDKLGQVITVRDYAGDSDLAAVAIAERLSMTHAIEVWCGERLVKLVDKHGAPHDGGTKPASE